MKNLVYFLMSFILISCNNERKFDEVKNIKDYPKTEFLATLENKISNDKNAIYCATLPFAWNEITDVTGKPSLINKKFSDLVLLNNTKSFKNVLNRNEYESSVEIEDDIIKAYVYFKKSLPFEHKLNSYTDKLTFNAVPVKSFGFTGYDEDEMINIIRIIYYKNDNNFIVKLLPKDNNHEIILFKSEQKFNTMSEMNDKIIELTNLGLVEKSNSKLNWKYQFREEDNIIIPKINFNIETNFSSLEGNNFYGFENNYKIESVIQRNAFLLDEYGAEIESELVFSVEAGTENAEEQPKPKHFIFDKSFYVLLKRTDSKNPYFCLWNTNAELLVK